MILQKNFLIEFINQMYTNGITPCIVKTDSGRFLSDPVFHINRNRVIAELVITLLRLGIEEDKSIIKEFIVFLLNNQHINGSWDEIHPRYRYPSALVTAIIGDALLVALAHDIHPDGIRNALDKAKDFVLENEQKPGFFLKSMKYTADHLNVDATCGAFLAHYSKYMNNEVSLNAGKRASDHIIDHQWSNGVYPYTIDKGNYDYVQQVPCLHYQGVTLYYLSKIHQITNDERLKESLLAGGNYLSSMQQDDGRFDWSQSGLLFAYYLTGAYAFAGASFDYLSKYDKNFKNHADKCLSILRDHQKSLFVRWEQDDWSSFPKSVFVSLQTAKQINISMKHTLYRFMYAMYRQIARRRYGEIIDDTLFNVIIRIANIKVSTIESFADYPDLFMTTEILNCLSSILNKEYNK